MGVVPTMPRTPFAPLMLLALSFATPVQSTELPRPAELEPAVDFWTSVYAEVDSDAGLLHDRRDLGVVYERIELDPDAPRAQRREHVDERRNHYAALLRRLAAMDDRSDVSGEKAKILEMFPGDVDTPRLTGAANDIRFQLGQADRFERGLIRAGAWEHHIYRVLQEMDLPRELAALPHVESSFNPDAYSRVGAAGIWQFTRATGQRFMRIDPIVDERMDPFASTVAAARLLKHNYAVTEDWALALTAYNHGLAGIRRAARTVGSTDIADIVREYEGRNWGFASRNFYAAFLAAVDVDYAWRHYFGLVDRAEPLVTDTVELPFYARIEDVIAAFAVSRDELRELNRGLRPTVWNGEKLVPRGYDLRVPAHEDAPSAEERLARIDAESRYYAQIPDRYHQVARGESLSRIANRYDVSTRELMRLNNLRNADLIRAGQELRLPTADRAPLQGPFYIIERGDTLGGIAQRAGMSVSALAQANAIDPADPIQPGTELRVDGQPVAKAEPALTTAETQASNHEEETQGGESATTTVADTTSATAEPTDDASPTSTVEILRADEFMAALMPAATQAGRSASPDSTFHGPPAAVETASRVARPARPPDRRGRDQSSSLASDPSDYDVAADGTIEVQAAETLGHYADWLNLRASQLRQVNGLAMGTPVVVGTRIQLDFSRVEPERFERLRRDYHQDLQIRFFERYQITGTEEHTVERGDSLWSLANRRENVPVWLLRQYNPELDFNELRPGMTFELPRVERRGQDEVGDQLAAHEQR